MNMYNTVAETEFDTSEDLITTHVSLVKRIAHHLSARLPESVDIDDLMQAGMIGLLEASSNFDDSRGASFETYAGIRIRGAMLDEVRKQDWTPRSVYRKQREVSDMIRSIETRTGRAAEAKEVADGLGISLDDYYDIVRDAAGSRLFSLNAAEDDSTYGFPEPRSTTATPDQELSQEQQSASIAAAIENLPEREQLVLSLYYERELNLKEIGEVLGVSESRICQIRSQAAMRLRSLIAD